MFQGKGRVALGTDDGGFDGVVHGVWVLGGSVFTAKGENAVCPQIDADWGNWSLGIRVFPETEGTRGRYPVHLTYLPRRA